MKNECNKCKCFNCENWEECSVCINCQLGKKDNFKTSQQDTIKKLIRALYIATERAVNNGNRLVKLGGTDMNRGQFLSLVDNVVKEAKKFVDIGEYNFNRFK